MAKVVQTKKTTLAGSGVTSTATSIILTSLKLPDGSTNVTMTSFGSIGFATLEPGTSREEQISFTGITQNVNGTAMLTGVTRGINFVSPYDETSAYKQAHPGGAVCVFSNTAGFYGEKFVDRTTAQTVAGAKTFSAIPKTTAGTPSDNTELTTKAYVDSVVNGGDVAINRVVVAGNAGETVAAGEVVYFDTTDEEWKLADGTSSYSNAIEFGIAQGAGTDGNLITNGVLIYGRDANQTGLTTADSMYISDTPGGVANSAGTIEYFVGVAQSATEIDVDFRRTTLPSSDEKAALNGTGTPSSANKYITSDSVGDNSIFPHATVQVFNSNDTALGDETSRFDITNPSGSTFRYTYDGTGTNPNITDVSVPTGSWIHINGSTSTVDYRNLGTFEITGSGTNYFEITNASGQTENDKVFDNNSAPGLRLTTTQTWTKPSGLAYATIEVQGGGAASEAIDSGGDVSSGGGAGAYAKKFFVDASDLGATETVLVGSGGHGADAGDDDFVENGVKSTFTITGGSTLTAGGGQGSTTATIGGAGGSASNGDININGGAGGAGSVTSPYFGGAGGHSFLGWGGHGMLAQYGAKPGVLGGGGGGKSTANTASGGENGGDGIVIVTEYYN